MNKFNIFLTNLTNISKKWVYSAVLDTGSERGQRYYTAGNIRGRAILSNSAGPFT
jgi:hypothetical protein